MYMSEQEENNIKVEPKTKKQKKTTEMVEDVSAVYRYEVEGDEVLLMDKPSEPLIIESSEPIKNKEPEMKKTSVPVKTNGQIYEAYIKELKSFKLIYNGDVVYDSTLSKNNNANIKFEADYFVLFGRKYSYNGLRIQKI